MSMAKHAKPCTLFRFWVFVLSETDKIHKHHQRQMEWEPAEQWHTHTHSLSRTRSAVQRAIESNWTRPKGQIMHVNTGFLFLLSPVICTHIASSITWTMFDIRCDQCCAQPSVRMRHFPFHWINWIHRHSTHAELRRRINSIPNGCENK